MLKLAQVREAVNNAAVQLHIVGVAEAIDTDLLFDDLGFDSFDVIDMLLEVEAALEVRVDEAALQTVWTLGDFVEAVSAHAVPLPQ